MPYKDIEKQKACMKEYRQRPEVKVKKKEDNKKYKQRPEIRARGKERWKKCVREKRKIADDLLGNECVFCGRTRDERKLLYHKKDGQHHSCNSFYLVIKNPDDWALLCYPCHGGVHWLMEVWRLSWDEIVEFYKGFTVIVLMRRRSL